MHLRPNERWFLSCLTSQPANLHDLCITTGFCRSTVCSMIKRLEARGVLTVKREPNKPNQYRTALEKPDSLDLSVGIEFGIFGPGDTGNDQENNDG